MFWIIIVISIFADQLSKYLVASNLSLGESVPFLGKLMDLHYILNDGATLSMLSGQRWFFVALTVIVLVLVLLLHYRVPRGYKAFHIALAFFIGGTLGNFIDRLFNGAVVDFLDPHLLSIFNVADCFITLSVIALCWMLLFGRLGKMLNAKNESDKHKKELKKNGR